MKAHGPPPTARSLFRPGSGTRSNPSDPNGTHSRRPSICALPTTTTAAATQNARSLFRQGSSRRSYPTDPNATHALRPGHRSLPAAPGGSSDYSALEPPASARQPRMQRASRKLPTARANDATSRQDECCLREGESSRRTGEHALEPGRQPNRQRRTPGDRTLIVPAGRATTRSNPSDPNATHSRLRDHRQSLPATGGSTRSDLPTNGDPLTASHTPDSKRSRPPAPLTGAPSTRHFILPSRPRMHSPTDARRPGQGTRFRRIVVRSASSNCPRHVTGLFRQAGHRAFTPGPTRRSYLFAAIGPDLGERRHCPAQVAYSEMHSDALRSAVASAQTASPSRRAPPSWSVSVRVRTQGKERTLLPRKPDGPPGERTALKPGETTRRHQGREAPPPAVTGHRAGARSSRERAHLGRTVNARHRGSRGRPACTGPGKAHALTSVRGTNLVHTDRAGARSAPCKPRTRRARKTGTRLRARRAAPTRRASARTGVNRARGDTAHLSHGCQQPDIVGGKADEWSASFDNCTCLVAKTRFAPFSATTAEGRGPENGSYSTAQTPYSASHPAHWFDGGTSAQTAVPTG
jgi:hypothetical protein